MAEETGTADESNFLRHISSRWLTLVPAIQRVLGNWALKKYFLEFIPLQKEYKYTLPKNNRYKRIKSYLSEKEHVRKLIIVYCRPIYQINMLAL